MARNSDETVDVRAVVEAVSGEDVTVAPLSMYALQRELWTGRDQIFADCIIPNFRKHLNGRIVERGTVESNSLVLNRQVVKSDSASIKVEGILTRAADELLSVLEERKLKACAEGESSFTFILDDLAGNSFIENPYAPSSDPSWTIKLYERTPEQQVL